MAEPSDILRKMINESEDQAADIQSSIDQVQAQIEELNEQIDALQNGMCLDISDSTGSLTLYLDSTKLEEIELLYGDPFNTPFELEYGPDYGKIDWVDGGVTDFKIVDSTGNTMYEHSGTNWDNDPHIQKFIDDFDFANDYLTRPLTTGATYGLIPSRDNLLGAKALLEQNRNKIVASEGALEDYAS